MSDLLSCFRRVGGCESITSDDEIWETLTRYMPSPGLNASSTLNDSLSLFSAELRRNNQQSGNFQVLVNRCIELLNQMGVWDGHQKVLQQCCGCIFLVRTCLKDMIETLQPEDLLTHLLFKPTANHEPCGLAGPLVDALLTLVGEAMLTDTTACLHKESMSALIVCMSSQLFVEQELAGTAPQPLLRAVLGTSRLTKERIVVRLLHHYMAPKTVESLLGSFAEYILFLPYNMFTYWFRVGQQAR
eukprot:3303176-Prymnesium_polylepis.1